MVFNVFKNVHLQLCKVKYFIMDKIFWEKIHERFIKYKIFIKIVTYTISYCFSVYLSLLSSNNQIQSKLLWIRKRHNG